MLKAMLSRADVAVGLLLGFLLIGWIAHGLVAQPADAPTITVFKRWQVVCPDRATAAAHCAMSQDVGDPKTGGTVIRFVVSGDTAAHKIDVAVPFNVLLQPALGIRLDEKPMQAFAYRTCNTFGCIATIADDKAYSAVLGAKKIRVYYETLNAKVSGWELSMSGFNEALAAMNDAEAKRHSWVRRVLL